ncbi:MAG: peptidase S41 [Flavobacteriaceae bacterium]|nr:peptidase S41 [Flavobacteriaceae bacterium]
MKKTLLIFTLVVSILFVSCFEDNDDNTQPASAVAIQDFIWRGLNFFYLYKADTAELANDAFTTQEEFNSFLASFDSPELFFDFLKSSRDRFSFLVSDYNDLEDALSGITLNHGMEFGLVRYPDGSDNVFGYARYILPNTDAESKGVTRGIIFNTINGQQITDVNFRDLIDPDTYTIGLATLANDIITPTGESIELTKTEYTENPIFINNTFDINGKKIGYLMYNAFTNEFDSQLNNVFGQFKSEGVTDLILDLRYNGGGSVRTATYLASMITGQFTGQTMYTEQWNEDRQSQFAKDGVFVNSFVSGGEAINSLNLTTVYVLTTSNTASASELIINSLNPYINVVQIGDNTTGKYQASFLMYDSPNFQRTVDINPNHTYAMLPLVFQTANANGFTNFDDGLIPTIEQFEDFTNLGVLGTQTEPLLATAIAEIAGIPIPGTRMPFTHMEVISESKANSPIYQTMIVEE